MCLGIATAAIGTASAVSGYIGQKQQADASNKFMKNRYAQVTAEALKAQNLSYNDINARLQQEDAAYSQQGQTQSVLSIMAKGRASAAAGEAGASGNSVDRLLAEFDRVETANQNILSQNRTWGYEQAQRQMEGIAADTQSRISGAAPQMTAPPSPAQLILGIGQSAIEGYGIHQRLYGGTGGTNSGTAVANTAYNPAARVDSAMLRITQNLRMGLI